MEWPSGALNALTARDEPRFAESVWLEIRKTTPFITHSIWEAVFLADRVAVMIRGRLHRDRDRYRPAPPAPPSVRESKQFRSHAALIRE